MLVLHGENIVASRKRLKEEIKAFRSQKRGEVIWLEEEKINLTQLRQGIEAPSIFGKKGLVIIENLLSSKKTKEKERVIDYLKKNLPSNLILWEKKKIDSKTLSLLGKTRVLQFKPDPLVFSFLDSLTPQNVPNSLMLLHRCLEQNPAEMVFYLLVKQIRLLILALEERRKALQELPFWKQKKIIKQAKSFSLQQLLRLYRQLLKIDWQQKTGQTSFSLESQLDLWVASI